MKLSDRIELAVAPVGADFIHIVDKDDLTDGPDGTSKFISLDTLKLFLHSVGFLDYNDLATTTTPIAVTSGTSPVKLTNDELGDFTNKDNAPDGVTDVWNEATDLFDFSELSIGDMVDIRIDIDVTTTQPNQQVDIDLRLAVGAFEYTIPFLRNDFKTVGVQRMVKFNGIYIGDANTKDNSAYFEISSDDDCSVVVNGWYCKIIKK